MIRALSVEILDVWFIFVGEVYGRFASLSSSINGCARATPSRSFVRDIAKTNEAFKVAFLCGIQRALISMTTRKDPSVSINDDRANTLTDHLSATLSVQDFRNPSLSRDSLSCR